MGRVCVHARFLLRLPCSKSFRHISIYIIYPPTKIGRCNTNLVLVAGACFLSKHKHSDREAAHGGLAFEGMQLDLYDLPQFASARARERVLPRGVEMVEEKVERT